MINSNGLEHLSRRTKWVWFYNCTISLLGFYCRLFKLDLESFLVLLAAVEISITHWWNCAVLWFQSHMSFFFIIFFLFLYHIFFVTFKFLSCHTTALYITIDWISLHRTILSLLLGPVRYNSGHHCKLLSYLDGRGCYTLSPK